MAEVSTPPITAPPSRDAPHPYVVWVDASSNLAFATKSLAVAGPFGNLTGCAFTWAPDTVLNCLTAGETLHIGRSIYDNENEEQSESDEGTRKCHFDLERSLSATCKIILLKYLVGWVWRSNLLKRNFPFFGYQQSIFILLNATGTLGWPELGHILHSSIVLTFPNQSGWCLASNVSCLSLVATGRKDSRAKHLFPFKLMLSRGTRHSSDFRICPWVPYQQRAVPSFKKFGSVSSSSLRTQTVHMLYPCRTIVTSERWQVLSAKREN